ncbi:hypothetical protein [Bacillus sp. FJAT-27231]|uniref:hypothetical protein n=1 Tax=Bacillus sp. FJAT-27231 TaxID=1679168 RepID=UPI0006715319|nr:hypothetical protein [Bacillus sp. FJAT-27231]
MNGGIVAALTAEATEILPGGLFSLYKNDGTAFKELVMSLFTVSMLGSVIANRPFILEQQEDARQKSAPLQPWLRE